MWSSVRKKGFVVGVFALLALLIGPAPAARADQLDCPVSHYGYSGIAVCGYGSGSVDWGGGNIEYFVIGTDFAIWHVWKGSGGWHSLGGQTSKFDTFGVTAWALENQNTGKLDVHILTQGTDGACWARKWPWTSGWYQTSLDHCTLQS